MTVEIFLHPSTTSPPPSAFGGVVAACLAAQGATVAEDGETVALADGSRINLFLDDQDDIALITVDEEACSQSVAEIAYELASATASFVLVGGMAVSLPGTGDVVPTLAGGFPLPTRFESREGFVDWLAGANDHSEDETPFTDADLEAAALAAAPPEPRTIVSGPEKPLFQRISDALFGKSI